MTTCDHPKLDGQMQATCQDGQYRVCMRVWCTECLGDFEFTGEVVRSLDGRQLLANIQPVTLVMNVARLEC